MNRWANRTVTNAVLLAIPLLLSIHAGCGGPEEPGAVEREAAANQESLAFFSEYVDPGDANLTITALIRFPGLTEWRCSSASCRFPVIIDRVVSPKRWPDTLPSPLAIMKGTLTLEPRGEALRGTLTLRKGGYHPVYEHVYSVQGDGAVLSLARDPGYSPGPLPEGTYRRARRLAQVEQELLGQWGRNAQRYLNGSWRSFSLFSLNVGWYGDACYDLPAFKMTELPVGQQRKAFMVHLYGSPNADKPDYEKPFDINGDGGEDLSSSDGAVTLSEATVDTIKDDRLKTVAVPDMKFEVLFLDEARKKLILVGAANRTTSAYARAYLGVYTRGEFSSPATANAWGVDTGICEQGGT